MSIPAIFHCTFVAERFSKDCPSETDSKQLFSQQALAISKTFMKDVQCTKNNEIHGDLQRLYEASPRFSPKR